MTVPCLCQTEVMGQEVECDYKLPGPPQSDPLSPVGFHSLPKQGQHLGPCVQPRAYGGGSIFKAH